MSEVDLFENKQDDCNFLNEERHLFMKLFENEKNKKIGKIFSIKNYSYTNYSI